MKKIQQQFPTLARILYKYKIFNMNPETLLPQRNYPYDAFVYRYIDFVFKFESSHTKEDLKSMIDNMVANCLWSRMILPRE